MNDRCWVHNFKAHLQAGQSRPVRLLETHVSWVLLSEAFAYKIKKPVNFGFLDFSELEQRRKFCHAEVTLNRRLAPQIYLDAVPIYGTPSSPTLSVASATRNGDSSPEPFEYAVKMHLFDPDQLLAHWLEQEHEAAELGRVMDVLGELIAEFHQHADRADADSEYAGWRLFGSRWQKTFAISSPC